MPSINLDEIIKSCFVFGCIKETARSVLNEKIHSLSNHITITPLGEYGYYIYSLPFYAQRAETEEMVWIKIGHFHDNEKLLSMGELITKGWVDPSGIHIDNLEGDGVLLGFNKNRPEFHLYRSLLSASAMYYLSGDEYFIAADNLRLVSDFHPNAELNDDAVVQHFIYRQLNGRETYFKQIYTLLAGELLAFNSSGFKVRLAKTFQIFSEVGLQKPVTSQTINWFFEEFKHIVGLYLDGKEDSSATMLSGGIDSSLVQAAINTQVNGDTRFPSLSFVIDSPGFAYEVDYAKEASQALNTQHTFVQLSQNGYADGLIQCTRVLGEPIPDDVRFCFYLLADHIKSNNHNLKYLFHGGHADGLHGGSNSLRTIQGDKYRSWPVSVLDLAGRLLAPISRSKSYGAWAAAEMLKSARDVSSKEHYLNSASVYTNWELVDKYFSANSIEAAFETKRNLEIQYLNSAYMVEKGSTLGLITVGIRQRALERAMGHFSGLEYVFPYGDEAIVKATYAFMPLERYVHGHRVKPILKGALESQTRDIETKKPKGWSGYGMSELFESMRRGELSDMVQAIERPGFMPRSDFEQNLRQPDWFTWNMLTLDLFKKYVLRT